MENSLKKEEILLFNFSDNIIKIKSIYEHRLALKEIPKKIKEELQKELILLNNLYKNLNISEESLNTNTKPNTYKDMLLVAELLFLYNIKLDTLFKVLTIEYAIQNNDDEDRIYNLHKNYWEVIRNNYLEDYQEFLYKIYNQKLKGFNPQKNKIEYNELTPAEEKFKYREDTKRFYAMIEINKNCNFKCTYCYEGLDKNTEVLKYDDIDTIVNSLVSFLKDKKETEGYNCSGFSLIGGEPTLVPSKVTQKLTNDLYLKLEEIGVPVVKFNLITNGYDVKKIKEFFGKDIPKDMQYIQVSYDGGLIHEKRRLGPKKESTLDLVKNNIKQLLKEDYFVGVKATLPLEDILDIEDAVDDYLKFEDEIENLNLKNPIKYYPTLDNSSMLALMLKTDIEKQKEIFKKIPKIFKKLINIEIDRYLYNDHTFTRWFMEADLHANKTGCSVINGSLIGLDLYNNFRGCHRTVYLEDKDNIFDYGKLDKDGIKKYQETKNKIEETLKSEEFQKFNKCSSCITLTCVKCPMINMKTQVRQIDTPIHNNTFINPLSHSDQLTCDINLIISPFLYMYLILKEK